MVWNLLSAANSSGAGGEGGSNSGSMVFFVIMIAVFALFMFWSRQSQKKREKEINDRLDAIQPGCKVMTIGYICGTVVEVCPEDNTLVLETGSETAGKSYIRVDRKAVFQTDTAAVYSAPVEEETFFDEAPVEVEETSTEEVFEEETPVETQENVEE